MFDPREPLFKVKNGNGAVFASISKDELLNQKFVIPNSELMSLFDTIVSAIDDKISTTGTQIKNLTQSRNCLLPKLMSDEIVSKEIQMLKD